MGSVLTMEAGRGFTLDEISAAPGGCDTPVQYGGKY